MHEARVGQRAWISSHTPPGHEWPFFSRTTQGFLTSLSHIVYVDEGTPVQLLGLGQGLLVDIHVMMRCTPVDVALACVPCSTRLSIISLRHAILDKVDGALEWDGWLGTRRAS